MTQRTFTVVGGGPVGSLLAISLARHGYKVGLYEGRPDSRQTNIYQGKSINIALSDRGWMSLEKIGISAEAKKQSIPMYHRAIHGVDGDLSSLPYGKEGDAIWSVSRGGINEQLLDIADDEANITTYFEHRLTDIDFESATGNIQSGKWRGVDRRVGLCVRRGWRAFEGTSACPQSAPVQLQPNLHAAVLYRTEHTRES